MHEEGMQNQMDRGVVWKWKNHACKTSLLKVTTLPLFQMSNTPYFLVMATILTFIALSFITTWVPLLANAKIFMVLMKDDPFVSTESK